MTAHSRETLRATFGSAAERYARARPHYPDAVFHEIARFAPPGRGARALEIGPGTGQATRPLAGLGYAVHAVELSQALAAVARRELADLPGVTIETGDFEQVALPAEPFDLALSATAFHWLDPARRAQKLAAGLRPGGAAALLHTHHVAGGSDAFFVDVQACYERFDPATPKGLRLTPADATADDDEGLAASGLFTQATFRRFEVDLPYTTAQYLDVLLTYSNHIALPDAARAGLLDCVADLIDRRYAGRITKRYLFTLALSRRTS